MSELDIYTSQEAANTNVEIESPSRAVEHAEGFVWDEYARLCQKLGLYATNEDHLGFQKRALQIEARWGLS